MLRGNQWYQRVTPVKQKSLPHNKGAEVGNEDWKQHDHNYTGHKASGGPMCLSELILQTTTINEK